MRRMVFLLIPLLLIPLPVRAQSGLTADQQALLDDVRAAFAVRDNWESYSQSTQQTTSFALTVIGTDVQRWQTDAITLESAADYDLAAGAAQGEITLQQRLTRYDSNPTNQRETLQFVVTNRSIFAGHDENDMLNVTRRQNDYVTFDLAKLADLGRTGHYVLPAALLDSTTAIFDLGVERDSQRHQIQRYDLNLDFGESLPHLDFDLDAFAGQFNGVVELGGFGDVLAENSTLKLQVAIDRTSNQLVSTTLVINIALEIEGADVVAVTAGDGVFTLDYGFQQGTHYYNVGEPFNIRAP